MYFAVKLSEIESKALIILENMVNQKVRRHRFYICDDALYSLSISNLVRANRAKNSK